MDSEIQKENCNGSIVNSVKEFPSLQEVFNNECELNSSNSMNSNRMNVDDILVNNAENNVNNTVGSQ